ncbi:hypothetical protein PQQ99_01115 [Paraburkholderia sediminicola]|uniref:helix-turn-helix transcriptional regulator n=1 Tax=Paraburkholderia sediminicola TaxID=458836 RepID=UPI0038BC0508
MPLAINDLQSLSSSINDFPQRLYGFPAPISLQAARLIQGDRMEIKDNTSIDNAQSAIERARAEAREELVRHGIHSMFVRVRDLSRLLGLPQSTIYAAIREGRFFLPHRMMLASPVVHIEDLVDWICNNQTSALKVIDTNPPSMSAASETATHVPRAAPLSKKRAQTTVPNDVVDRIADAAMARVAGRPRRPR